MNCFNISAKYHVYLYLYSIELAKLYHLFGQEDKIESIFSWIRKKRPGFASSPSANGMLFKSYCIASPSVLYWTCFISPVRVSNFKERSNDC